MKKIDIKLGIKIQNGKYFSTCCGNQQVFNTRDLVRQLLYATHRSCSNEVLDLFITEDENKPLFKQQQNKVLTFDDIFEMNYALMLFAITTYKMYDRMNIPQDGIYYTDGTVEHL